MLKQSRIVVSFRLKTGSNDRDDGVGEIYQVESSNLNNQLYNVG